MDKGKKKNIKRIIAVICLTAVVALLAAMPLLARQVPEQDGPQASILSGTAGYGSISTRLIGGGTLAEEEVVTLSVPSAVKLTSFLVSNGDTVTEGTPIAAVDRVTVMTSISQVQDTLQTLAEEIQQAGNSENEETISALAGGLVKILYAEEDQTVQSIMLEHGALAVLSLDGLMAVDLEVESSLATGEKVTVTLADGTTATGTVAKNLAGDMTVTLEDDGYAVAESVQISAEDGTVLGTGALYIYSPWNATAYAGTVESIEAAEGDWLEAGDALIQLSDVGYSAAYRQLVAQRQAYEELMLELFQMYQTETVTAPCDGVVSGIDQDSLQLLSSQGTSYQLTFLSNAPTGDDQTLYANYLGQVTAVASNGWVLKVNPQPQPVADYLMITEMIPNTKEMTHMVLHTQQELPIFTLTDGKWVLANAQSVQAGDTLLFAADREGQLVWSVLLPRKENTNRPGGTATPDTPTRPGTSDTPTQPDTPDSPTEPEASQPSTQPEGSTPPSQDRPQQNFPGTQTTPNFSGGNWEGSTPQGSYPQGNYPQGSMPQEPENELYGMQLTQIAAVTPQSSMTLDITVDEQDMTSLSLGMAARIRIDALGGEKYDATITALGNTGTNNGGSSKYTVTLTVNRAENMLSGMTATATVELSSKEQVLTVPADALVEQGNQTLIYTGYDQENETLIQPVPVTVGVSDGETVEILDGLTDGQVYYYAYYDTLEISFTPDFGGMGGGLFGR